MELAPLDSCLRILMFCFSVSSDRKGRTTAAWRTFAPADWTFFALGNPDYPNIYLASRGEIEAPLRSDVSPEPYLHCRPKVISRFALAACLHFLAKIIAATVL